MIDNKGDEVSADFKSKFLSDAERAKEQLDTVSPTLCLAKWQQVSLHLPTGLTNSCYHPPLHEINPKAIKIHPAALHNTDIKKAERQQMLSGERPTGCSYCWAMEDQGKLSDRHYRSGEPWAAKAFDKIVSQPWDTDVTPSYVEVNFNHACNLKCSYCSPQFSSSWQEEVDREGAYPTSNRHNDPSYFTGRRKPIPIREANPYVDAFWEWWPTLYPELEHFRMTGGEPLMDKNTHRVLDYVIDHPSPKLHLNVTSNLSVDQRLWDKYLDKVKRITERPGTVEHFMQYVSVDGWGKPAEYMRHGLDFDLLWDRVNQFLSEVPERSSITFIVTMNNLSITSLDSLFAGILGLRKLYSTTYQRVWFDTPVLRSPVWQSLQILPPEYADQLERIWAWMLRNLETEETRFKGFKDYELHRLDRDIAWMRASPFDAATLRSHRADFYRFFAEHDRRRGTDFAATFPELLDFWNRCKYYATKP